MWRGAVVGVVLLLAGCERQPEQTAVATDATDGASPALAVPADPATVPVVVKRQLAPESEQLGLRTQAFELEVQRAGCRRRCTRYQVSWLFFPGQPALNQHLLGEAGGAARPPADAEAAASRMQQTGRLFVQDAEGSHIPWDARLVLRLLPGVGEVRVLAQEQWTFTGGAHGSTQLIYLNWHVGESRVLTLDDLLLPGQLSAFWHLVEQAYDDWLRGKDNPEVFMESWPFQRTENVALLAAGVRLQYQAYELGPYVEGMPAFDISYDQLQGVLRPEFLPE